MLWMEPKLRLSDLLGITQLLRGGAGTATQAARSLASVPLLSQGAQTLIAEDRMRQRNHSEDSGRQEPGYVAGVGLLGTSSKHD